MPYKVTPGVHVGVGVGLPAVAVAVGVGVNVVVAVGVGVNVAVGVAVGATVGVEVAVAVAVAVGVGVATPAGWSAPIAGGFRRGSPSKSLVMPAIIRPAATQGLAGDMCRSTVAAFPFGLMKSGLTEMLLAS
jgi:hypothetical protein